MAIQHMERGLTTEEIRTEILKALRNNHVHKCEMDELYSIFFDPSDVWVNQKSLQDRVAKTYDPIRLEEAGRVVINPMLYYVLGEEKYYVYGG